MDSLKHIRPLVKVRSLCIKLNENACICEMNYEQIQNLKLTDFKRYFGVRHETFKEMVKVVKVEKILQKKPRITSKLYIEDQILMTLGYLREYPTFFHLGIKWGIDESNAYKIVVKVEKILIKSELFSLLEKNTFEE